jgi:hypothetical protein
LNLDPRSDHSHYNLSLPSTVLHSKFHDTVKLKRTVRFLIILNLLSCSFMLCTSCFIQDSLETLRRGLGNMGGHENKGNFFTSNLCKISLFILIQLSLQQAAVMFVKKKYSYPRNRPWRPIGL